MIEHLDETKTPETMEEFITRWAKIVAQVSMITPESDKEKKIKYNTLLALKERPKNEPDTDELNTTLLGVDWDADEHMYYNEKGEYQYFGEAEFISDDVVEFFAKYRIPYIVSHCDWGRNWVWDYLEKKRKFSQDNPIISVQLPKRK